MEVDPDELLFTQDSIAFRFRPPHQEQTIDHAVDSILRGEKTASDFPRLQVVKHEGRLWSLDNRRLWVFKMARVPVVTVDLVRYDWHNRFPDLMENKQELKQRILQKGYLPDVRGPTEYTRPIEIDSRQRLPRRRTPVNMGREGSFRNPPQPVRPRIPEWHFPRETSTFHRTFESDEDFEEPVENDSRPHTQILIVLTIVIFVLTWALGRAADSKLLSVVNGSFGQTARREPAKKRLVGYFGRGLMNIIFWVVNETMGKLIPAVISWVFRIVWEMIWRIVWAGLSR